MPYNITDLDHITIFVQQSDGKYDEYVISDKDLCERIYKKTNKSIKGISKKHDEFGKDSKISMNFIYKNDSQEISIGYDDSLIVVKENRKNTNDYYIFRNKSVSKLRNYVEELYDTR